MKQTEQFVKFELIHYNRNPRIHNSGHELIASILERGLDTMPYVSLEEKDYFLLRGYRRMDALSQIREDFPEEFAKLFGRGIKCIVISDATPAEKAMLHIDHGLQKGLTNYMEILNAFEMLFEAGLPEIKIAAHMASILDNIGGKYSNADLKALNALKATDPVAYQKKYLDVRKGWIQQAKRIWQNPKLVYWSLWAKHVGLEEIPEVLRDDLIENITHDEIAKLLKALDKDIAESAGEDLRYSKTKPGPNWLALWEKMKQERLEKVTNPKKKPKNAKTLEEISKVLESKGFLEIFQELSGEVDGYQAIKNADSKLKSLELLEKYDKEFYNLIISRGSKILTNIILKNNPVDGLFSMVQGEPLPPFVKVEEVVTEEKIVTIDELNNN